MEPSATIPMQLGFATTATPTFGLGFKGPFNAGISHSVYSVGAPFGLGNTENPKNPFPPKLSRPYPAKKPKKANTGIVSPARLQTPSSRGVEGAHIPSSIPRPRPRTVRGSNTLKIGKPKISVSQIDHHTFDHPATSKAGAIPSSIGNSPIFALWGSFGLKLKSKLIAAGKQLPTSVSRKNSLNVLWASLDPDVKEQILAAAQSLPTSSPEASVPTISDLVNECYLEWEDKSDRTANSLGGQIC
ncbi:hypothetical protein BU23DRAFT_82964 [Bimuria novae-zelandiae CBS 107.79]|uniref:Uncharacterized protein n=1 Tax=Bimuria novae-zelandiae CBS 107.79 TaxID=1447943 RepID=A0A6A5VEX5_9PLEO|nr:hypothetical protein BU23DRAFT_82964 [Bimuria novae-zelandiae CBS 107.79]